MIPWEFHAKYVAIFSFAIDLSQAIFIHWWRDKTYAYIIYGKPTSTKYC